MTGLAESGPVSPAAVPPLSTSTPSGHGTPANRVPLFAMTGRVLAMLTATALLVSFSESMLIPALPDIGSQFNANPAATAWVPAIYLLTGAISVPLFGKLGDIHGKKRMLVLVMVAYSAGVVLDGFAWNLASLLVFRGVQGIGLAMFPLAIALMQDELPTDRIPVAVGLVGSMAGVGAAIGLIGGGAVTEHYGWQTNYHLLAPFAVALTILLYVFAQESDRRAREQIDYRGLTVFGIAVTTLLVGITEAGSLGWGHPITVGLLTASAASFLALVIIELRVSQPLLTVREREFTSLLKVNLTMLLTGAAMFLAFYLLIYYAQEPAVGGGVGLGRNVQQVASILAPAAIMMLVFAPLGGRLTQRWGPRTVELLGAALTIAGFALVSFFRMGPYELGGSCIVILAGVAFLLTSLSVSILLISPPESTATETGLNTAFRTLGQSVGVALSGALLAGFVVPGTTYPSDLAYGLIAITGIAFGLIEVLILATLPNLRSTQSAPPVPV